MKVCFHRKSKLHTALYVFCAAGSINISNILTGKCLAKINAHNTLVIKECKCSGRPCNLCKAVRATEITSTVEDALEDITAIFYDEERNDIYTGKGNGFLHVWSNYKTSPCIKDDKPCLV